MDPLNLAGDDAIRRRIPKIIVDGIRCEAVLTGRRLIIVERESGRIFRDLPFETILTVEAGVNAIHEPVLIVSSGSAGEPQKTEIVFVYQPGGQNIQEIERSLAFFRDLGITSQNNGLVSPKAPKSRLAAVDTSQHPEEEVSRHPASDRTVAGRPWQFRNQPPEDEPKKSQYGTVTLVVVVIAIIIGSAFLVGNSLHPQPPAAKTTPAPTPEPTPEETATAPAEAQNTVTPVTTGPGPAPNASATPVPRTTPRITSLPVKGFWAKISYPGNYTGYIGGDGRRIAVNGYGTDYIRLPFQNTTIDGSIEKRDGSSDLLEVEIFNGGILESKAGTRMPYGVAEIHTPIGLPKGFDDFPPTPTPKIAVIPTPDPSLTLRTVPQTGVWVRVAYPGTFSGSIASNGDWRSVTGSGDQFYQLSMTDGLVEAQVEKTDYLDNNLIVEVYKNGTRITGGNTTIPLGKVAIYSPV